MDLGGPILLSVSFPLVKRSNLAHYSVGFSTKWISILPELASNRFQLNSDNIIFWQLTLSVNLLSPSRNYGHDSLV